MKIDEARLEAAQAAGAQMTAAIKALDAPTILKLLNDGPRTEFAIGSNYRIAVIAAPIAQREPETPEPTDTMGEALTKLTGVDSAEVSRDASLIEIRGTYRGRATTPGLPHVFRMPNGETALLADMDLVAWELLT